jgi:hypothetical protein
MKRPENQGFEDNQKSYRTAFGGRLSALLDQFDSRVTAADVAGVVPDQLGRYVRGVAKPPLEVIARLAKAQNVSLDWLWWGEGARTLGGDLPDSSLVPVPYYDMRASAGSGQMVESEEPLAHLYFDRSWLARHRINPLGAGLITAEGNSMRPTIEDGDPLLIDRSDREPRDKVYLFRRGGALLIKELRRRSDGALQLVSHNPAYGPEELPRDQADDLEIIARVAMAIRAV